LLSLKNFRAVFFVKRSQSSWSLMKRIFLNGSIILIHFYIILFNKSERPDYFVKKDIIYLPMDSIMNMIFIIKLNPDNLIWSQFEKVFFMKWRSLKLLKC
jgi:hypothetical protein